MKKTKYLFTNGSMVKVNGEWVTKLADNPAPQLSPEEIEAQKERIRKAEESIGLDKIIEEFAKKHGF